MRFIILGSGLSGLSCGAALAMNGHQVVLIEKKEDVGGLAGSLRIDGYTFDYGPHLLFGPKVLPLLREILTPDLKLTPVMRNMEMIYLGKRYFKFPFEPKNLLFNMERKRIPGVLFELLLGGILGNEKNKSAQNVEEWVIRSVGKRFYYYMSLGGYIQKLYGISPKEVSQEWGIQKLKFLGRLQNKNLFQIGLKALKEKKNLQSQVVNYPPSGIDQIAFHIKKQLINTGGKIFLNSQALSIEKKRNGAVLHLRKDGQDETIEGDFLVSTIPVSSLVKMIHPAPPKDISKMANFLRYRSLLLVLLFITKERVLDYQCIYYTEADTSFRRVTEFKNLVKTMSPNCKTSLCVEMTCFEGDIISMSDKQTIYKTVVKELHRLGLLNESDVERYLVIKIPYAYPVYDIGNHSVLSRVLDYLGQLDTIISIGRQGLFHYNNMSHSILSGYQVGQALSDTQYNDFKGIIQNVYQERIGKYKSFQYN